jgi:MFS transporter, DHA1 family, inner membrane transport protein
MGSKQSGVGGQSESISLAAEVRGGEMVLLLILASVQFTSIVDFMVVMPLGPQLQRKLDIDNAQFSWIVASYTVAAGLAGLLGSSIMDRFGRKSAFLTLYTGFLLGTLVCGLSTGYYMLLVARVLTGAFGGILGGMALAIIADVFPEERRGRATGILMSAFATASVVGVPTGIYLGGMLGWHAPFLVLAALGLPVLFAGLRVLPPLRDHLHYATHSHPWNQIVETFGHSNHLRAFTLTVAVMLGSFSVIPSISLYLVSNVGVDETKELPWVFVTGGILTLIGAPLIGRMADRYGKLPVYRVVATVAIALIFVVTNLPRVPLAVAVGVVGLFMLSNAGRMVAALTMITGSVERRLRGGFMSANSAVQHLASGLGAAIGGQILVKAADGTQQHFNRIGLFAAAATALSLWVAGRVRPAQEASRAVDAQSGDTTLLPQVSETTLDYPADPVGAEPI